MELEKKLVEEKIQYAGWFVKITGGILSVSSVVMMFFALSAVGNYPRAVGISLFFLFPTLLGMYVYRFGQACERGRVQMDKAEDWFSTFNFISCLALLTGIGGILFLIALFSTFPAAKAIKEYRNHS